MISLDTELENWLGAIRTTLARLWSMDESAIFLPSKPGDRFRLLILKTWCLRYSVPLPFVLTTLLEQFAWLAKSQHGAKRSLGISVATLTGAIAEKRLEETIVKAFPNGEHLGVMRSKRQTSMLAFNPLIKTSPKLTLQEMLSAYRKKAYARRKQHDQAKKHYLRPWRGNPWR